MESNKGLVINHKTGKCIWYHTTPNRNVSKILKEGLKINSTPEYQNAPEPWIYVSTVPWSGGEGKTIFEVDLSDISVLEAGWPFGQDEDPIEKRWQLRVMKNIPPDKISLYQASGE